MVAKRKRYGAEQSIGKLREAEVGLAQGHSVGQVARKLGVSEQTYYRWRREYGGMRVDQAKRLKELERENAQLKKFAVSERRPGVVVGQARATERLRAARVVRRAGGWAASWRWPRGSVVTTTAGWPHCSVERGGR